MRLVPSVPCSCSSAGCAAPLQGDFGALLVRLPPPGALASPGVPTGVWVPWSALSACPLL